MAARCGLEPQKTDPESVVLPITLPGNLTYDFLKYSLKNYLVELSNVSWASKFNLTLLKAYIGQSPLTLPSKMSIIVIFRVSYGKGNLCLNWVIKVSFSGFFYLLSAATTVSFRLKITIPARRAPPSSVFYGHP